MSSSTPNMGLTRWDLSSDPYDHNQFAANLTLIDLHDHTPGKGKRLSGTSLTDGSIGTTQLADGSVTTGKIADNAVTQAKMDRAYVHPLGEVMMWWRPNALTGVPTGWVVPTGQTLTSAQHDFAGGGSIILPDFRNRFPLGAVTSGGGSGVGNPPNIGDVGGSMTQNHGHTHPVPSHGHGVDAHYHTINHDGPTTSVGGAHQHRHIAQIGQNPTSAAWQIVNPTNQDILHQAGLLTDYIYYDTVTLTQNRQIVEFANPPPDATVAPYDIKRYIVVSSLDPGHAHYVNAHNHGGVTNNHSPGTTSVSLTTGSSGNSSQDSRPSYVGLLFIMKVKL